MKKFISHLAITGLLIVPAILSGQSSAAQTASLFADLPNSTINSPVNERTENTAIDADKEKYSLANQFDKLPSVFSRGYSTLNKSDNAESAFPKGSLGIGLGIGLGNIYWGTGYGAGFPVSPTVTVDYALTDKLGIGNIAIGITGSYSSSKYSDIYNSYNYSGILVGFRGSYHFILPGTIGKKLDPYAGVLLAYIITKDPVNTDLSYGLPGKASAFQPGVFAGAHYFFADHIGAYAELGYNGFSIFSLGITFKF